MPVPGVSIKLLCMGTLLLTPQAERWGEKKREEERGRGKRRQGDMKEGDLLTQTRLLGCSWGQQQQHQRKPARGQICS